MRRELEMNLSINGKIFPRDLRFHHFSQSKQIHNSSSSHRSRSIQQQRKPAQLGSCLRASLGRIIGPEMSSGFHFSRVPRNSLARFPKFRNGYGGGLTVFFVGTTSLFAVPLSPRTDLIWNFQSGVASSLRIETNQNIYNE